MLRLRRSRAKNNGVCENEYSMSNFIPYSHFWDDETVQLKNGSLMKVMKLNGFSFETADDEDVDVRKSVRNQLFRGMANAEFGLYFHIVRRRQDSSHIDFSSSTIPNMFADELNQRWRSHYTSSKSFVNDLYVSVVRKGGNKSLAMLSSLMSKFNRSSTESIHARSMKEAHEEVSEITNRIAASLRDYNPRILGVRRTEDGAYSEILEFISKITNCGTGGNVLMPKIDIAEYIPSHRLYFGSNMIEIVGPNKVRYASIVSLKEYGQNTSAGMLDTFLQLPYELIVTQSFQFTNRQVAIRKMQVQQNRLIQSEDKAVSQIAEISRALDDAMSGRIAFGEHHLSILCMEDTVRGLEGAMSLAEAELINTGVYTVKERMNMEPSFWAQLPGNFDFIARKAVINTLNLSGFVSLHNYPVGKKNDNHWGEAVTVLETTSGTPFFFNFHVRDVGHTTIIGPTGSGKTVLMNFLCAQSMKFNPRLFFFDKDRGAEIFIRALDGNYSIIESRTETGFNPLQIDDVAENRTFLLEWLSLLVSAHGETVTSAEKAVLNEAIDGNYRLDKEDRILRNLVPFLGLDGPGTLAGRMAEWHGTGGHAAVFDNVIDNINFAKENVFGFEMGHVLKDKVALGPVLLYLFHRINTSLDGTPTMIVLDEAWALIDNEVFAPKIKDWLKVLRKLNTFVVFATQSVEDASNSAISDTLIQQTATQIFLPNLKATSAYRKIFMLSEREFVIVKNTDPTSRYFLVKQNTESIVARIDLRKMQDIVEILSGRAETVIILDQVRKEVGDDPRVWIPEFLKRVDNA